MTEKILTVWNIAMQDAEYVSLEKEGEKIFLQLKQVFKERGYLPDDVRESFNEQIRQIQLKSYDLFCRKYPEIVTDDDGSILSANSPTLRKRMKTLNEHAIRASKVN